MKKLMKINSLVFCLCFFISVNSFAQKESANGNYQVRKIHEADDYYLIFLKKDNKNCTIFSKKEIIIDGIEVKKDSTYYFELTPLPTTITFADGTKITPMPDLNITYFGGFRASDIGTLCTAHNLVGLRIKKSPLK